MRGTSRESLDAVRDTLAQRLESADAGAVGSELFSVAGVLDSSAALRRALTDANNDGESKARLVAKLLGGQVSETTLGIVGDLARARWSATRDLGDALVELGVDATVQGADKAGELDTVEDQLFRFGRILQGDPALYGAVTDRRAPASAKTDLVQKLLAGKASAYTVRLATQVAAHPRGQRVEKALEELGQSIAEQRQRKVAVVTTAVDLDNLQRTRLQQALARIYGRAIQLNIEVDPRLVGGLRIQVGGEVIDASVLTRLDEAQRRVAG